jgi:putative endonuclease
MSTRRKGRRGEALAEAVLEKSGYTIIERNWRCAEGELDLVAFHRGELVFIEVRARAAGTDTALESITPRKRAKLSLLALTYIVDHQLDKPSYRIDVVAVNLTGNPSVEIIENAVGW